jgi:hypothetical protein
MILKKPKSERTSQEILAIYTYLTKVNFLKDLRKSLPNPDVMLYLCETISLEIFSTNEKIFACGDIGEKYYIIL